jgi:hypothetical protein
MLLVMVKKIFNVKLYLISSGTSSNDIIESINIHKKKIKQDEKKSSFGKFFFNALFKKKKSKNKNSHELTKNIDYEDYNRLELIGIKEIMLSKKNMESKKNILNEFSNLLSTNNQNLKNVYSSLDYNCIETSSLLFDKNFIITICPFISQLVNKYTIKKYLEQYKSHFGIEKNILHNYWKTNRYISNIFNNKNKLIESSKQTNVTKQNSILQIPKEVQQSELNKFIINMNSKIDWKYVNKNDIKNYSINSFKDFLKNRIIDSIKKKNRVSPFIFVLNAEFINELISHFYNIKYNLYIENTSIFSIDLEISIDSIFHFFQYESVKQLKKVYPTRFNKLNNMNIENITVQESNKTSIIKYIYEYTFKNNKYTLFNFNDKIGIEFIKKMNLQRMSENKREEIEKYLIDINSFFEIRKTVNENSKSVHDSTPSSRSIIHPVTKKNSLLRVTSKNKIKRVNNNRKKNNTKKLTQIKSNENQNSKKNINTTNKLNVNPNIKLNMKTNIKNSMKTEIKIEEKDEIKIEGKNEIGFKNELKPDKKIEIEIQRNINTKNKKELKPEQKVNNQVPKIIQRNETTINKAIYETMKINVKTKKDEEESKEDEEEGNKEEGNKEQGNKQEKKETNKIIKKKKKKKSKKIIINN